MTLLVPLIAGIVPVVAFLVGLVLLDSYRLVATRHVLRALLAGVIAALAAFAVNLFVLRSTAIDPELLRRYVAPVIEETCKALYVVWLIRRHRVGFIMDAAILGFAVGAGFALTENLYYAWTIDDRGVLLWLVRGLGTAVMHGGTTAIVAILAKDLSDRRRTSAWGVFVPGLALATIVHSAFNHLASHSLVTSSILLVAMPLLVVSVFERSEAATRAWLGAGLDTDVEALELIAGGSISNSPVGYYLTELREHFPGPVVADMLCMLQIHLELAVRAKGLLIARGAGIDLAPDEGVRRRLEELRFLERSIGPTGRLALMPLLRTHSRDLWQIHLMRGA